VEVEEGVLVLKRIHVVMTLKDVAPDKVDAAQRAHDIHRTRCPIYRSLYKSIDITTELQLVPAGT
jgi:uncharacterized OsmC-like protein